MSTIIVDLDRINWLAYTLHMLTPEQCRAARAWLNMSQDDLAKRANVSLSTIRDFEAETREPIANNVDAIQRVFANEGMAFSSLPGMPNGFLYEGRIKERDTYLPVLGILDGEPGGFMKTSELIRSLELWFNPRGEDAEILAGRSDTRFSQIVRNIVSHKSSSTNMIGRGWAIYDARRRRLQITEAGKQYLESEKRQGHLTYTRE
jgi:DNA-binding XRE family transcriptional regulator